MRATRWTGAQCVFARTTGSMMDAPPPAHVRGDSYFAAAAAAAAVAVLLHR